MLQIRVIPCLLLKGRGLVKTVRFMNPQYLGDPINAVKIFNDKKVDELIFLDILASREGSKPNLDLISDLAGECFMPFTYGGGVRDINTIEQLLKSGVEKVAINSFAVEDPTFIRTASRAFGSQSIIAAIDVKKNPWGRYDVYAYGGTRKTPWDAVEFAMLAEAIGAGEIFLNSIDRDGTMAGYDNELIQRVSAAVRIPVIASGGAGRIEDFGKAVQAGASAVAAGSFFVYQDKNQSFLINVPSREELEKVLRQR
jgi:cyclase